MMTKYKTLIDYILSGDPRAKILSQDGKSIKAGFTSIGGTTIYTLTEVNDFLLINWLSDTPTMGKHTLDWKFSTSHDQEDIKKIITDKLQSYQLDLWQKRADQELKNIKSYEDKNNNSGCYIATLVYGDYNHSQVVILRKYRDQVLLNTTLGILFVKFYYLISPKIVKILSKQERINSVIKKMIDMIIKYLL